MDAWERFENRPDNPYRTPPGRRQRAYSDDPESMASIDERDGECEGMTFHIVYVDAKGDETERTIRLHNGPTDPPDGLCRAWCHLRESFRSFYFSRMVEVFDYATGESLGTGAQVLARITEARRTASERIETISEINAFAREHLRVLGWFALSDGVIHRREADAIVDHLEAVHRGRGLPGRMNRPALVHAVENYTASRRSAAAAFNALLQQEADVSDLTDAIGRVMRADGVVSESEMAALRAIVASATAKRRRLEQPAEAPTTKRQGRRPRASG